MMENDERGLLQKILGTIKERRFILSVTLSVAINCLMLLCLLQSTVFYRFVGNILAISFCFLIFALFSLSQITHSEGFFMVVGIGYGFVGVSSLISRASTQAFLTPSNNGVDVATQILLTSRFIEIIAFYVGIILANKSFRGWKAPVITFGLFLLLQTLFFCLILWWQVFPALYHGNKPTVFRRVMEYICVALFFLTIGLLFWRRKCFSVNVFVYISICVTIRAITSIFNSILVDTDKGAPIIVANSLRVLAYTFLFISIGISSLRNPLETLFRHLDLKHVALENEKVVVAWMIEQVPSIAVLLNEQGGMIHINKYAIETFDSNLTKDSLSRHNFFDYFTFEDDDPQRLFKSLVSNRLPNGILTLRSLKTKTDDNRVIEWTLKRVKTNTNMSEVTSLRSSRSDIEMGSFKSSQSGSIDEEDLERSQVLCLGQDITDKMERERLLAKARNDAEKLAMMKDSFVANISHELRTPLNCIVGVTDLLGQASLTTAHKDMVSMVKMAANSLLSLINDILDLTKLKQKGHVKLVHGSIGLHSFIESCMMSLGVLLQTGNVEIAYRISRDCPAIIQNDEKRLKQVLYNLLSNSIKFTTKGQIIVTVNSITNDKGVPSLEIQISDSGVGIKAADLPLLFQRFYQADHGKDRRQGTGIGLTITKQLIELMGGSISVTSEVSVGTTMKVIIPVNITPESPDSVITLIPLGSTNENIEVEVKSDDEYSLSPSSGSDNADLEIVPRSSPQLVFLYMENHKVSDLLAETLRVDYSLECSSFPSLQDLNNKLASTVRRPPRVLSVVVEVNRLNELDRAALQAIQKDGAIIQIVSLLPSSDYTTERNNHFPPEFRMDYVRKIIQMSTLVSLLKNAKRSEKTTPKPVGLASPTVTPKEERTEALVPIEVLIVEDNATNQKVMKLMLDQIKGVKYEIAENGQVAVDKFLAKSYDCIFMDCQMPVMDGIEATVEIRKIEEAKPELGRTHITALTANAFSDERERCFSAGMDDHITKPIGLKTFITKLDSVRAMVKEKRDAETQQQPPSS